jgi:hypothetical protein
MGALDVKHQFLTTASFLPFLRIRLFGPQWSHPFVPTSRGSLMPAARRGGQGWPSAKSFTTHTSFPGHSLTDPEHGGKARAASGPTDQWRSPTSGQIRALIPAQPQAQSAETSKATLARAANAPAAPAPLSIGQKVAVVTIANSASCKSFDDIRPEGDIDCLWA